MFDFDTCPDRAKTDSAKWSHEGRLAMFGNADAIPMHVADMDVACAPAICEAVQQRAAHPNYGYRSGNGHNEAFADWCAERFGWEIDPSWVINTEGVVPAIRLAIQRFTQPGDKVLIQPPVYRPFARSVELNGRHLVTNELVAKSSRYEIDFDDFEAKVADPDVKLFVLCSPHNPVGRVWSKDELCRMADACIANNVLIVSDEIHADLTMPGVQHTPLASLDSNYAAHTITCMAPSKTFNVAGLQCSNIVIPSEKLRHEFGWVIHRMGTSCPNVFGAVAAEAGYRHGAPWLDELREHLAENLACAKQYIAKEMPLACSFEHEGTYLLWIDFNAYGLTDSELMDLFARQAGVALSPGTDFGACGSGFMRLNFGCPRAQLEEALERMALVLKPYEKEG